MHCSNEDTLLSGDGSMGKVINYLWGEIDREENLKINFFFMSLSFCLFIDIE